MKKQMKPKYKKRQYTLIIQAISTIVFVVVFFFAGRLSNSESVKTSEKGVFAPMVSQMQLQTGQPAQMESCKSSDIQLALVNKSSELLESLEVSDINSPIKVSLSDGKDCLYNVTAHIDAVARSANPSLSDGFADYIYVQGADFLVSRPTELWKISLDMGRATKIWEVAGAQSNSLAITRVAPFSFNSGKIVIFQVQPTGLGGVDDDSTQVRKRDCALPSAGMWVYETSSGKVRKVSRLNYEEICR